MIRPFLKAVTLAITCILTVGCGVAPRNIQTITNDEVGPYPTDYQFTVQSYFEQALKDPDSAKYQWTGEPFKGYARIGFGHTQTIEYGWVVPVKVNAKNSYGGYTGWKEHHLLVVMDHVVHHVDPQPGYPEDWLNGETDS